MIRCGTNWEKHKDSPRLSRIADRLVTKRRQRRKLCNWRVVVCNGLGRFGDGLSLADHLIKLTVEPERLNFLITKRLRTRVCLYCMCDRGNDVPGLDTVIICNRAGCIPNGLTTMR